MSSILAIIILTVFTVLLFKAIVEEHGFTETILMLMLVVLAMWSLFTVAELLVSLGVI